MRPTGTEKVDFRKKLKIQDQKHIHQKNKLIGRIKRNKKKQKTTKKIQNLDVPLFLFLLWFTLFVFIFV